MILLQGSCLSATQHPCTARMLTKPRAVQRARCSCLKSAAAQLEAKTRQRSGTCLVRTASRTRKRQVCSVSCCASDQHCGPDISLLHPRLQLQWDHVGNAHLGNIRITPHSGRSVCWVCNECPLGFPHRWTAKVCHRTDGTQCPFCANRNPCQHNCLAIQAPAIAAEFSSKNEGTPYDYLVKSNKKVHWQCDLGHEWLATVHSRTLRKAGCPSCYKNGQSCALVKHPVLADSQHPMMQLWDWEMNAKAGLDPSQITCRSSKKAHWICLHCPRGQPHRWQAAVYHLFQGTRCPCCSGKKACICNSLQSLAPEVAAEWDYTKNKGTPSNYTAFSRAKMWWHNDSRGSFQAAIADRTYVRKPQPGS